MTFTIDATYSPEDNKLRLYASQRLDGETYQRVKAAGFKWAPKQELFVAPAWTPDREDLCIELAGEITAEQTTLIERAEAKAERLDNLAYKRANQASAYQAAAHRLSERFAAGQPILVGHHSEKSARRDKQKMQNAMDAAVKAAKAVDYWSYRAEGVERHANYKSAPGVRARRIKTLLADLRDKQRTINHAKLMLKLWEKIDAVKNQDDQAKLTLKYAGAVLRTGNAAPGGVWDKLDKGELTTQEAINKCLRHHDFIANSAYIMRWINHILNRLAYENYELFEQSECPRYLGEITPVILQAFAREHGADKPAAKQAGEFWLLESPVDLPAHFIDGNVLALPADAWRDLMQSCGYVVPITKPKAPAILNFKADYIAVKMWGRVQVFRQIELTKAEYTAIYKDYRGVKPSKCGQFRVKVCKHPKQSGYSAEWVSVYITDAKAHPAPESSAILSRADAEKLKNGEAA